MVPTWEQLANLEVVAYHQNAGTSSYGNKF